MAARAALGEDLLAARDEVVIGQIFIVARRIGEVVGFRRGQEEEGHVGRLQLVRVPVVRGLAAIGDLDRTGDRSADERDEVRQPVLAEEADVEVDAVERAEGADGVGAVLQHVRGVGRHRLRVVERAGERRQGRDVVVELLVVGAAAGGELLRAELVPEHEPRVEVVDRVHGARVVDLVRGDEGGVERAGTGGVEKLPDEARLILIEHEDARDPEVLGAGIAVQVREGRVLRILRRIRRVRADVAEAARHADAVRLHQIGAVVVVLVFVVRLRVPRLLRLLVEVGIR